MKRHGTQTKTSGRTVKLHKLRTGHLFAGAGGGLLADLLLGHQPIFAVEIEDYPRKVLEQRQADGVLPFFPTFGDIKDFDGTPWRGTVDVLCGGFPCQDISAAGKGAGITGERSGLWKEYARLIGEMRPKFVFAENSPLLRSRGLALVLSDLAEMGYDARWCVLGADQFGGIHHRKRLWVLASDSNVQYEKRGCEKQVFRVANLSGIIPAGMDKNELSLRRLLTSGLCRWPNRLPSQVDRLKAAGNAQVPGVAASAFNILSEGLI
jgi:DNA (cytosine-5)-methyltransferase 1